DEPGARTPANRSKGKRGGGMSAAIVLARLAEPIHHAPVGEERQSLEAEGRSRAVAAQALEAVAIGSVHCDASVDVEAVHLGGPRAWATLVFDVVGGAAHSNESRAEQ